MTKENFGDWKAEQEIVQVILQHECHRDCGDREDHLEVGDKTLGIPKSMIRFF
jgi:hypothetical protein